MWNLFNLEENGSDDVITLLSTSRQSAECTHFDLRPATDTTRLRFEPIVANDPKSNSKIVKGRIVYEKKGRNEAFPLDQNTPAFSKSQVHNGDALMLALNSAETKALYEGLRKYYEFSDGLTEIPVGVAQYVRVDRAVQTILDRLKSDPAAIRMITDESTFELVKELLEVLARGVSNEDLHNALSDLEEGSLQSLSSSISLERLHRIRDEFVENMDCHLERTWQDFFEKNAWIIPQVLPFPCALYSSQAYVGGKSLLNRGGGYPDFLFKNKLTKNLAILEIKTPKTNLLGSPYRDGCYPPSCELTGAVSQALNYKQKLMRDFHALYFKSGGEIEASSPTSIIVLGNTSELDDTDKNSSFENFRSCLNGVIVLTYDELLSKLDDLISILSSSENSL